MYAEVERLDLAVADEGALLDAMTAAQRLMGALTARSLAAAAELHRRRVGAAEERRVQAVIARDVQALRVARRGVTLAERSVEAEIALALSCSRSLAAQQVSTALSLTGKLPRTFEALAAGDLEPRKAAVIADRVGGIEDDQVRSAVEDEVLPSARSWTLPTLREQIRKQVFRLEPAAAEQAHERARAGRRVVFTAVEDDMLELWALLPLDDGARVRAALNVAADRAASPGEDRTADQRRADTLVDLLVRGIEQPDAGSAASASNVSGPRRRQVRRSRRKRALRHEIQVVVPFETVTGDADEPGYLNRFGPISAHLARKMALDVARDGVWRCVVTDDEHGTVLGLGTSTFSPDYRIADRVKRLLDVRDRYCTFPGCRAAAVDCEKDHQLPWPHGPSCDCNLCNRCKVHHLLKHEAGFGVRFSTVPEHPPGTLIWTTPAGREYPEFPTVVGVPRPRPGRRPGGGRSGASGHREPVTVGGGRRDGPDPWSVPYDPATDTSTGPAPPY